MHGAVQLFVPATVHRLLRASARFFGVRCESCSANFGLSVSACTVVVAVVLGALWNALGHVSFSLWQVSLRVGRMVSARLGGFIVDMRKGGFVLLPDVLV